MTAAQPTCTVCGQPMTARDERRRRRVACSRTCGQQWSRIWAEKNRAERIEDVEDLLSMGETHEQVALRIGVTPGALSRQLYRAGCLDLARAFNSVAKRRLRASRSSRAAA